MAPYFDVDAVLRSLALEEKISLLAGASFTETISIPSKNVPSIRCLDGPNGVRSAATDRSIHSACFPAACSIAATFDRGLTRRVGRSLAVEARRKAAHCLLGPTVCIHRHPLGGRNFESFSEDPFLSGKLASQYVQGLQELGVSATVKHFVANEQETQRTTVNEMITERALREIYLKPFEIAVREATPWAIMTAYNEVNGTHCDSNEWLLKQVLRGEWGWQGLVMSDWGGTNSVAAALKAGLALEMPGPPKVRKLPAILSALGKDEISETVIDDRAREVLMFAHKLKGLEAPADASEDDPEFRKFTRDVAARGMVLLKNENGILPLSRDKIKGKKVALIGYAKDALAHGGGSAAVNAYHKVSPWDGLNAALGNDVEFTFAAGARRERLLPPLNRDGSSGTVSDLEGNPGFSFLFFGDGIQEPVKARHGQGLSAYSPIGSTESLWHTIEMVADFNPLESGNHYIACSGLGPTEIYIDDEIIFEQKGNSSDPMGSLFLAAPEPEIQHRFEAGKTCRVRIRSLPPVNIGLEVLEGRSGARVGFLLESVYKADLQGEAVRVARDADFAIIFSGHDSSWETEGRDQDDFNLPHGQDKLISAVSAVNKSTVVVNSTGVAVAMPWLDQVPGVMQAWFAGQECGNAIADVIMGIINPEGHLPMTFPRGIEDAPAHGNFPGEYVEGKLTVNYAESVFVGYRHFDRLERDKVNFPFGHGLSYSTFEFISMEVEKDSRTDYVCEVAVGIANTSDVAGSTLVQIYVGRSQQLSEHPIKALVGFQKAQLFPGENKTISLLVSMRDFAYFDETAKEWIVDEGDYIFYLGKSAAEILRTVTISLRKTTWKP